MASWARCARQQGRGQRSVSARSVPAARCGCAGGCGRWRACRQCPWPSMAGPAAGSECELGSIKHWCLRRGLCRALQQAPRSKATAAAATRRSSCWQLAAVASRRGRHAYMLAQRHVHTFRGVALCGLRSPRGLPTGVPPREAAARRRSRPASRRDIGVFGGRCSQHTRCRGVVTCPVLPGANETPCGLKHVKQRLPGLGGSRAGLRFLLLFWGWPRHSAHFTAVFYCTPIHYIGSPP